MTLKPLVKPIIIEVIGKGLIASEDLTDESEFEKTIQPSNPDKGIKALNDFQSYS